MQYVGIVGSRRRDTDDDYRMLVKLLRSPRFKEEYTIVSGGCPKGGDAFAERYAKANGISILIHYPDWNNNGRAAGIIRNTKIAESCDVLIALVAEDRTGGAEDTIRKVRELNKPVITITEDKILTLQIKTKG